MIVLATVSQKGGVGKSMMARACAVAALYDGTASAIMDTDPQGTCTKWSARRQQPAPAVVPADGASFRACLDQLRDRGAQLVVIDTPPHLRSLVSMAVEAADAAIIPVRPSIDDLEAIGDTAAIIRTIGKPAGIIINQAKTDRAAVVTMARTALAALGYPVCPIAAVDRIVHQHATGYGQTAMEYDSASKGAEEIVGIWDWVKGTLLR